MAPGSTVKGALSPEVSGSPLVGVAVRTTPFSADVYVMPRIVTRLAPAGIAPVTFPPSAPRPVRSPNWIPVAVATGRVTPAASRDCTTTEKSVPAVGWAPSLSELIASVVGGTPDEVLWNAIQ